MNRRPLKSRQSAIMQALARDLARRGIAPNAISVASMVFAAFGALAMLAGGAGGYLFAALCCQLRLVCNLVDGLVAVEGGQGSADGPFWNEVPDRVSDILLLGAAGFAAGAGWLGVAAAVGAVLTAYLREFGRAEGLGTDFRGPMAKPQRMAVLTLALVMAAGEPLVRDTPILLWLALWVIVIGTAMTSARRATRIVTGLRARGRP